METHRYKELADALGLSINQFEKEIGVKQSRVSKAVQRNADVSEDIVLRITTTYPNVNRIWLLTGEGDMFLKSTSDRVKELANTDLPHPPPANLTEYLLMDKLTYMQKELETLKKEIGKLKDKNVKE